MANVILKTLVSFYDALNSDTEKMTHLNVGDIAPNFDTHDEKGTRVQLSDFKGKKLVLFFYPADNTPGCTVEACNLRDNYAVLRQKGIEMLGVSPDSAQKHQKFSAKHQFPFSLLPDENREILKAYGVWGEKKFMGRVFDGVHRTTFLIDETGKIQHIFTKVKTNSHAEQILELLG